MSKMKSVPNSKRVRIIPLTEVKFDGKKKRVVPMTNADGKPIVALETMDGKSLGTVANGLSC